MNEKFFSLGKRLGTCAEFVREGKVMADVGTDHAYLPIWLVNSGRIPRAYASDINDEPIKSAQAHIDKYNLSGNIMTFTCSGLEKIPRDDTDDIVIAGMGGDTIVSIISEANWVKNTKYRLILQPMSKIEKLREYLYSENFNIIKEKAICESNRLYTVICAEYSNQPVLFDEFDIYAGGLSNSDINSVHLIERQAKVLLAEAHGCAKCGDLQNEQRLKKIASGLLNYVNKGEC